MFSTIIHGVGEGRGKANEGGESPDLMHHGFRLIVIYAERSRYSKDRKVAGEKDKGEGAEWDGWTWGGEWGSTDWFTVLIRDNYQVEEIVARITRICKSFECPAVSRCARINPLHPRYPLFLSTFFADRNKRNRFKSKIEFSLSFSRMKI